MTAAFQVKYDQIQTIQSRLATNLNDTGLRDSLSEVLNEYLFLEVYAFVLDRLREYFVMFKNSADYVQLEDEIKRQERLYEVLVEAELISDD